MPSHRATSALLGVVLWTALTACDGPLKPSDGNAGATRSEDGSGAAPVPVPGTESGDYLYGQHCASCHGTLAQTTKQGRTSEQITAAIDGVPAMAAVASLKTLSAEQVGRIAFSLATPSGEPEPPALTGGDLYGRHCASCHGELAASAKHNRSAAQIAAAIGNVPDMAGLKILSEQSVTMIAQALVQGVDLNEGTDAEKGAALYAANCVGAECHTSLETSSKRGRTAAQIAEAALTIVDMSGITALSVEELRLIEVALAVDGGGDDGGDGGEDPETGEALYAASCAFSDCHHGPLPTSTKRDRSAQQIADAIASVPRMAARSDLKALTADQVRKIAAVLRADGPGLGRPLMMNREQLAARLSRIFFSVPNADAIRQIVEVEILDRPEVFGGACSRLDRDCGANTGRAQFLDATMLPVPNLTRAARLQRACLSLLQLPDTADRLATLAGGLASTAPSRAQIKALSARFTPASSVAEGTLDALEAVAAAAATDGRSTETQWRLVAYPLCASLHTESTALALGANEGRNELRLYARCHLQLTGAEANGSTAPWTSVRDGLKTAAQACGELVAGVSLDATGLIADRTGVNVKVLGTLHKLHSSWFTSRDFHEDGAPGFAMIRKTKLDSSSPALFYTRALFADTAFKDVFRGVKNYVATRADGPSATALGEPGLIRDRTAFKTLEYADVGALVGIREDHDLVLTDTNGVGLNLLASHGGGILGSASYLTQNQQLTGWVQRKFTAGYIAPPDGGVRVFRRWGKNVFADFLCRDLPAIDAADANTTLYVRPASKVPFRTTPECVGCHASMDQLAGVLRGLGYHNNGDRSAANNLTGISSIVAAPVSAPRQTDDWPDDGDAAGEVQDGIDPLYHLRPTSGRLVYRAAGGILVNTEVNSVEDVGRALGQSVDLYRCVTRRYYEYFTGVTVPQRPSGSPAPEEALHWREVNRLTGEFRANDHQSLRRLIQGILASPGYRR